MRVARRPGGGSGFRKLPANNLVGRDWVDILLYSYSASDTKFVDKVLKFAISNFTKKLRACVLKKCMESLHHHTQGIRK